MNINTKALYEIFSKEEVKVLKTLLMKDKVNDFNLAVSIRMRPVKVKAILNILYNEGFLEYRKYRRGRLICTNWQINKERFIQYVLNKLKDKLEIVKDILERKDGYYCPSCYTYYSSLDAYDYGFLCPECGYEVELQCYDDVYEKYLNKRKKLLEKILKNIKINI